MTKPQQQELITTGTQLPADIIAEMEKSTGAGLSTDQRDNLVPLIYLLQKLSPQVEERDPRYIQGAKPGDLWLRGAPQEIWPGNEGFLFQPCHFFHDWIEWIPRAKGGGFIARHAPLNIPEKMEDCPVSDAQKQVDPQNANKVKWVRPNGNEVILSRNFAGYVLNGAQAWAFVIPMSSSGHTVARAWMMDLNQRMSPGGKRLDANWNIYRIKSRSRTNAQGTWYTWFPQHEGFVNSLEIANRGKALHNAFVSGEKQAAAPEEREDERADRGPVDEEIPF